MKSNLQPLPYPIHFNDALNAERKRNVMLALEEDGYQNDLSARLVDNSRQSVNAQLIVREKTRLCGAPWFQDVMHALDINSIDWHVQEGENAAAHSAICTVQGTAAAILTAERSALNFLQTYSAVATLCQTYLRAIPEALRTQVAVMDTRKTIPGHRFAQKYAVSVGGGQNQRLNLADAVLIKENHIAAAGSVTKAWQRATALYDTDTALQIEVENNQQLEEALTAGARCILLDNFSLKALEDASRINTNYGAALEASGNITLTNIADVAATGIHRISLGALTKNIKAIDFSLRFL